MKRTFKRLFSDNKFGILLVGVRSIVSTLILLTMFSSEMAAQFTQTTFTFASNYSGIMYSNGPFGVSSSLCPSGDGAIMITFVNDGIILDDNISKPHFYPYIGESPDGRLTYNDPNMANQGNHIIGVFAKKDWKQITVVSTIVTGAFYSEVHRGYNYYGLGKEAWIKYWTIQNQATNNSITPFIDNNQETTNNNSNRNPEDDYVTEPCSFCHGTGQNPCCEYGPDYTGGQIKTFEYCNICKTTKESHYHLRCPSCNGTGKNKRRIRW